jgi:PAS domain S-box-containing protein
MTKGGGRLDVLLKATSRRNGQDNIIGVVDIVQDITGCLAQEHKYSHLIDTANVPIFGVEMFRRITVWNECASHLFGYSIQEVMVWLLVQDYITDKFKTMVQMLDQALTGDETNNFEFLLITKSGYGIEVLLNATSCQDKQGNVIDVVGIGQDIRAQ